MTFQRKKNHFRPQKQFLAAVHICIRILSVLYYYKSKLKRRVPLLSSSALSFYIEISKKISVVYEYIWEPAECFFFQVIFLVMSLRQLCFQFMGKKIILNMEKVFCSERISFILWLNYVWGIPIILYLSYVLSCQKSPRKNITAIYLRIIFYK